MKPKAKHKLILVDAFLPEVPSIYANKRGKAEATSIATGVKRAVHDILRQPGIKGKHIKTMRLTVSVLRAEEHDG